MPSFDILSKQEHNTFMVIFSPAMKESIVSKTFPLYPKDVV